MHPQTLRKYERAGLVMPSRSAGMLRLYSEEDVRRLRMVKRWVDELGLNLAGAGLTIEMVGKLNQVRQALAGSATPQLLQHLRTELDGLLARLERAEAGEVNQP